MKKDNLKEERIPGIDLLRVLLSFSVIVIHVLHFGGLRTNATPADMGFYVIWFVGCAIVCTVNCFAIISGFVMYDHVFKYTNILRLFLTVVYHGLMISSFFNICMPGSVSKENLIQSLFPISQDTYWYFTSYFCVFFFAPLLTQGMKHLSKKQADVLVLCIIIVLSVFSNFNLMDIFDLDRGFSALWLMGLFIIGTYLRKYQNEWMYSNAKLIIIYLGCVSFTYLGVILSVIHPGARSMMLIEYTSPSLVIAAIALVLLFASVKLPSFIRKIVKFCAPFAFSIYIIHEHPLIRKHIIMDRFTSFLYQPAPTLLLSIFFVSLLIWGVCFLMEYIRWHIFRILDIDSFLRRSEEKLSRWFSDSSQNG